MISKKRNEMRPIVLNEELLCTHTAKKARVVGTVFMKNDFFQNEIVVLGTPTHADVANQYREFINHGLLRQKKEFITDEQFNIILKNSIDFIIGDCLFLRPNPKQIKLAFRADEIFQTIISKHNIKFLGTFDEKIRLPIKKRGEYWRIPPPPTTIKEQIYEIDGSRSPLKTQLEYYYNKYSGIRILTYANFEKIKDLPEEEIKKCVDEVVYYSKSINKKGNPDVGFFMTKNFGANNFIENSDYKKLLQLFHDAVPAPYRTDNYEDTIWRRTMLEELFKDNPYQIITEEDALGLCPEFRMHIRWLPGARITKTEVDFDAVFSDKTVKEWDYLFKNPPLTEIVDPKIKEFITNYMMEYDSIDYINFGEIMETVSRRVKMEGRRTVYIVAIKIPQKTEEIVKIIRLQKFGHIEYVKEDKAHPAMESNHYGQWVKDRYVACERLGMKVMSLRMNHIAEVYNGGIVYTAYSERKYIRGSATDKIMPYKYSNSSYTKEFARLLGEAAALNIVIGRVVKNNDKVKVLFDDGDEILTENEYGLPKDIHVSSITGSLYDYDIEHQLLPDLMNYVEEYAGPVIRRKELVKDIEEFRDEYLNAFSERFKALQKQYKKQKSAFDKLFKDRIYDSGGSIACRWERLLIRVEKTNVDELVERIRTCIDNNI